MKPAPTSNLTCTNATIPLDAPIKNGPGERSPEKLRAVVAQFDVVANPRYKQRDSSGDGKRDTFCNIALWDFTRALGCEIDHYDAQGNERNANAVCVWLASPLGAKAGWSLVDPMIAGSAAARGQPVVVAWANPKGIGHVALLLPPHGVELRIAQAGAHNLFDVPIARFGVAVQAVKFYAHA